MKKPTFWFSTWSDTNQAVQLQKMARGLKFRTEKVEGLYYLCSKNKGADQLAVTAKLICVFVFGLHINVGFLMTRLILYNLCSKKQTCLSG